MYVYHVDDESGLRDFVSLLPPDRIVEGGLPPMAVIGKLRKRIDEGGEVTPDNLEVNPVMVEYLHAFIARTTSQLDSLQSAARAANAKGDRYLLYIDGRTSARVDVPAGDRLGQFEIVDGRIATWRRNGLHRILTDKGLFRLDPETERLYLDALSAEAALVPR